MTTFFKLAGGHEKCSKRGTWNPEEENCLCFGGYIGPECERLIDDKENCLNGGKWDSEQENCQCIGGYIGPKCEQLIGESKSFKIFPIIKLAK